MTEVHLARREADPEPFMLPEQIGPGRYKVRGTWGRVQPIQVAPGVITTGELEVIRHVEDGELLVDTRRADFRRRATIPASIWIDHGDIVRQIDRLPRDRETVFFCNGPQCGSTPDAIHALLQGGFPAPAILYHRGGMHDWTTLGNPTVADPEV